jgi:hypothetical protein
MPAAICLPPPLLPHTRTPTHGHFYKILIMFIYFFNKKTLYKPP